MNQYELERRVVEATSLQDTVDVLSEFNGSGAAEQASLCDIVAQVTRDGLGAPVQAVPVTLDELMRKYPQAALCIGLLIDACKKTSEGRKVLARWDECRGKALAEAAPATTQGDRDERYSVDRK